MMKYQVRFRDIDPDTGLISQDSIIAACNTEKDAKWVQDALTVEWFSPGGACDPNREFYIVDCSISI